MAIPYHILYNDSLSFILFCMIIMLNNALAFTPILLKPLEKDMFEVSGTCRCILVNQVTAY